MKQTFPHCTGRQGSTLLAVIGFIVAISLLFATVMSRSMDRYQQISQTASWQEALVAAETGSDTAINQLRLSLIDPGAAFAGWSTTADDGTTLLNGGRRHVIPALQHGGDFNTQLNAVATIDAPPELIDSNDRQWYRVRSTGTTLLPGVARTTLEKRDRLLRKFSFVRNWKTGEDVPRPQSSRSVELILKPVSFENAIVSDLAMSLNNHKIIVDSYDSRSDESSTNGLYDPDKRQDHGDIATNSALIDAGDAHIYGDAFTNQGVIENGANISGEHRDDFYQDLNPVKAPTDWSPIEPTPAPIAGNRIFVGGTKAAPKRYKMDQLSITGTSQVVIAPSALGTESYAEIWLTGDLKVAGSGSIVVRPNANVTIYLQGNIDIKGNGTFNANSQPARLQILGIEPPAGEKRDMNFSGNGVLVAAIYAPDHAVTFGATGSAGTMWGSLTGRSLTMGGSTYFHYDEALADSGYITDYKIRSWYEDNL